MQGEVLQNGFVVLQQHPGGFINDQNSFIKVIETEVWLELDFKSIKCLISPFVRQTCRDLLMITWDRSVLAVNLSQFYLRALLSVGKHLISLSNWLFEGILLRPIIFLNNWHELVPGASWWLARSVFELFLVSVTIWSLANHYSRWSLLNLHLYVNSLRWKGVFNDFKIQQLLLWALVMHWLVEKFKVYVFSDSLIWFHLRIEFKLEFWSVFNIPSHIFQAIELIDVVFVNRI